MFFLLLCVCAILPEKDVPEMTYTVSGGTLNPTHSLTHPLFIRVVSKKLKGGAIHRWSRSLKSWMRPIFTDS